MLFKPEHKQMILDGIKTATRRIWKRPMVRKGGIYKCKLKMISKDYFAEIVIMDLYKQKLRDMNDEDAKKEGYEDIKSFKEIWIKINGAWNGNQEVTVIEFIKALRMKQRTMRGYCLNCGSEKIGWREIQSK